MSLIPVRQNTIRTEAQARTTGSGVGVTTGACHLMISVSGHLVAVQWQSSGRRGERSDELMSC